MELNGDVTDNFLRKCYIDNLLVTKALLGNECLDENTVRTLSVVRGARARLAKRLLERENDPAYISKMQRVGISIRQRSPICTGALST
jgi:hypothetical protein